MGERENGMAIIKKWEEGKCNCDGIEKVEEKKTVMAILKNERKVKKWTKENIQKWAKENMKKWGKEKTEWI